MEITKWNETFENADTRKRQRLGWLFIPTGCDSNGYLSLVAQEGGFEAFGIFLAICQWSATQPRELRGKLIRTNGEPLTEKDIAVRIRAEVCQVSAALKLLKSNAVGWITGGESQESASNLPVICQSHPDFVQGEGQGEGQGQGFLNEPEKMKTTSLPSSETYVESTATVHPEEGGKEDSSISLIEEKKHPFTEEMLLFIARRKEIPEDFARTLWLDLLSTDFVTANGTRLVSPASYLLACWERQSVRTAERGSKPADGKREPWMIEADIKRAKAEIQRIQSDKANRNHGGHGPNLADHKAEFEDAWLADLRKLRDAVKRELPAEWAKFERGHAEHVAAMIADKVPADAMGEDYMLGRLSEAMPEEVPSFERWDREWNKPNAWKDPGKLTSEARAMVKQLKAHVERLEGELRGVMVAV